MKTLIYCYRSGWVNNMLGLAMAGVVSRPLTCPTLTAETFPYERLADVDLIYIALHGSPKTRLLRGDDGIPALSADAIAAGPRIHAIVILEGCYGAKTAFPRVFLERGAKMVIGNKEQTFDKRRGLGKAGKAGSSIVKSLRAGMAIESIDLAGFEVLRDVNFYL